jgi:hypothetical protein
MENNLIDISIEVTDRSGVVQFKDIASVMIRYNQEPLLQQRLIINVLDYTYVLNQSGEIIETIKNK